MPVSNYRNIPHIMGIVRNTAIKPDTTINSVLDIGCGFGKLGFLIREFLDVRLKRYYSSDWLVRLDTVEIYDKYITPVHKYLYDNIVIGDIVEEVDSIPDYDIIIMSEVLEHIEKGDGYCLLNKLVKKTKHSLILSFPVNCKLGDPKWDNPHEAHISQWCLEDIQQINPEFKHIASTVFALVK